MRRTVFEGFDKFRSQEAQVITLFKLFQKLESARKRTDFCGNLQRGAHFYADFLKIYRFFKIAQKNVI